MQMDINGRQLTRAMGYDNDNAAASATTAPQRVGGLYNLALPTYDSGDQVSDQHDVNGRKLVRASGEAADNGARVGNPVLIGFAYDAALPTYDTGDVAIPHTDINGRVLVREDTLSRATGVRDADTIRVTVSIDDFQLGAGVETANTLRVTMATDTVSLMQGQAADNAAAVNNPVYVAGIYNATPPTYDDLDAAAFQMDINGNLKTAAPSVAPVLTVKEAAITAGVAAIRLTTDAAAPDADRRLLSFQPDSNSTARFFYGSAGVTTANGVEVFPGQIIERENDADDYYIISDTAAQTVRVVEKE
jgi:hypothetical protein